MREGERRRAKAEEKAGEGGMLHLECLRQVVAEEVERMVAMAEGRRRSRQQLGHGSVTEAA